MLEDIFDPAPFMAWEGMDPHALSLVLQAFVREAIAGPCRKSRRGALLLADGMLEVGVNRRADGRPCTCGLPGADAEVGYSTADGARPGARGFVKRHAQHPGLRAFRLTGHVLPPVEPLPGALVVENTKAGVLAAAWAHHDASAATKEQP